MTGFNLRRKRTKPKRSYELPSYQKRDSLLTRTEAELDELERQSRAVKARAAER